MYNIFKHSHSGLMWLIVAFLILSVLLSLLSLIKKDDAFASKFMKIYGITRWLLYIQFIFGAILYFISPMVSFESGFMKNADLRFTAIEHPIMMLVVIGFVSMGLFKSKKKATAVLKSKTILIFYAIALVIAVTMIPWKAVMAA